MKEGSRSLRQLLESIQLWGDRLARFIHGVSREDFSADELRQAGSSKCIEAIGEASGEILTIYVPRLAAEVRQLLSDSDAP